MGKTTNYGFTSFTSLQNYLKGKATRKLDNNTYVAGDSSKITVSLHGNPIAVFTENTVELSACGWNTVTTRNRLNRLPFGGFHQKDFLLHYNGVCISSHDKVILNWNGEWLNQPEVNP